MAILGNLLGMVSRGRRYGSSGLLNRGHGRQRGYASSGMGRPRSTGFFGGSLGRMAMGGMAAWATRRLLNRRYR